jgi:hypothetical protein
MNEVELTDLTPAERRSLRLPGGNTNKYNARKTRIGEYVFDSAAEARYYQQLLLRQAAGEISGLRVHVGFQLAGENGDTVGIYVADFTYMEAGKMRVADVKGGQATKTPLYRLKRNLMRCQGFEVEEVEA